MIRKLLGLCAAAATVALLVVVALHRDRRISLFDAGPAAPAVSAPATSAPTRAVSDKTEQADGALPADSLTVSSASTSADGAR